MSEAETTEATDAPEAVQQDGSEQVPTLNYGPTYQEIGETLKESPEKYEYGKDADQDYVDRDSIDFDPKDGLYTGTEVTGDGAAADTEGDTEGDTKGDADDHDRPKPGPGTAES